MKKTLLCIYAMLLGVVVGYAQEQGDIPELPNLIPPSPTAYELGKYGEVQVGHFTGTIQPSVPLTVYKTNNLQLPISLSYNSSGIKVDQLTSNVGLGWSLNIGGVISRTVRGKPDEERNSQIPESIIGNYGSQEAIRYFETFSTTNSGIENKDTSIDIFNYNFLGKSGQFVLDRNKDIVHLTPNGLKIERSNGFVITDQIGIVYHFSVFEKTATRNIFGSSSIQPWSKENVTAWYLTKIVHPKGDEINIKYDSDTYTYDLSKAQSYSVQSTFVQPDCFGSPPSMDNSGKVSILGVTKSRIVGGKKITEISNNRTTDKIKISYRRNPDFEVNLNNIIDKISIENATQNEIDFFQFKYLVTNKKRLFLEEIGYKNPEKKYHFKYIRPELLSERLSLSQDHWGYYNGKLNTYFFPNPSKLIETRGTSLEKKDIGADKEVNSIASRYGVLEEIQYPTKGVSKFTYENHSKVILDKIYPEKTSVSIGAGESPGPPPPTGTSVNGIRIKDSGEITTPDYEQTVTISTFIGLDDFSVSCSNINVPPHRVSAIFSVYDVTHSENPDLLVDTAAGRYPIGNSANIAAHRPYKTFYLTLRANTTYRFTLQSGECVMATANFLFHKEKPIPETIEKTELIGGLRIKRQENIPYEGKSEVTSFYYGALNDLNKSSIVNIHNPWYTYESTYLKDCSSSGPIDPWWCSTAKFTYNNISSSSLRNLYGASFTPNYRYVTTSYGGDNFEGGGEEKEFLANSSGPNSISTTGSVLYGKYLKNSPLDNWGWDNGLLKNSLFFKKKGNSFLKVKEITNHYKRDNRYNTIVYGLTIKKNYSFHCTKASPNVENLENLDVMENQLRTNWFYMDRSEQKLYDENGANPITSTTNYFYDNDQHLQPTRTETTDSNGLVLKTKTYYPDDVTSTSSLGHDNLTTTEKAAIDQLKTQNRIAEPIQVESYKNNVLQSTQRTNYKSFGGLYLPEFVQTAKGGSGLEDRVVYHNYDNKGNPVEVSKKDGIKIYYVWGYQQTQPIAKIEGYGSITSAQQTAINNAITASNNDVSEATENTLRTRLQTLRNSFTNEATQVTTFTYNPLVGVTSVTDPRGITMYYEYDAFNRLHLIKNSDGHIVKENEYHYKN